MNVPDPTLVLDRRQLHQVTLEDEDLMREIVAALVDDTSRQIHSLDSAVRAQDSDQCARIAHYSKGACANVGANRAAAVLERIEHLAKAGLVSDIRSQIETLAEEIDRLRTESL